MDEGTRPDPAQVRDTQAEAGWQLRAYRRLSRLLLLHSYRAKVFLLAFATTHIPLLALIAYVLLVTDLPRDTVWQIVGVTLVATLVGTALALLGLGVMLAPVRRASRALAAYRTEGTRPTLPTDIDDEGGQLLADVQHTLVELDAVLAETRDVASRDGLTGLFNRREGARRLREDLAMARSTGSSFAVMVIDADGLKVVNDRWGHVAGDAYLQHLASVLIEDVGTDDWVARWGGDEFVVRCADETAAQGLLERINASLTTRPVAVASRDEVTCRVTGGVATSHRADGPSDLIDRADRALYRTKRQRPAEMAGGLDRSRSAQSSDASPRVASDRARR